MVRLSVAVALTALALAGCVSTTENVQSPTATEMMLNAHSAEGAAAGLNLRLPVASKVFVDDDYVNLTPAAKYAVAAVRAHLLGHGLCLVDKAQADIVVEVRVSAASIDDLNRVLGIPAMSVPSVRQDVPAISIPELAIWSRHERNGVTELSATARDAKTGRLISAVGPVFATSRIVNQHVVTGFVSGDLLERPGIRSAVTP